jgi:protein phosphatase
MSSHIIKLPQLSLILLVGASGCGKSTFARKYFKPTEVLSSDYCRALVSDNENNQKATKDAFDVLYYIAEKRLKAGLLTVIDATNVQKESRNGLVALAKRFHLLPVSIVFNIDPDICHERNKTRADRDFGSHVVRNQYNQLQRSLKNLRKKEGFAHVYVLNSVEEIESTMIERQPLWNNKAHEKGPFDIIGDVHGCFDELKTLLIKLGYEINFNSGYHVSHAAHRKIIFVGDLVDRGPNSPEVLRLAMDMVESGIAFCVNGNHDEKLKRKLMGRDVKIAHGLERTLSQLENESEDFKIKLSKFLDGFISHYVFDDGKLAVAHAGLKEEYIGRGSARIRDFCMYGETSGEIDGFGFPVRYPWEKDYRGDTIIVYGHTPVPELEWINNTINIDTGCVFGGKLTALRYPEREIVSVNAEKIYYESVKPLANDSTKNNIVDNILNIEDVFGKRIITTQLHNNVTIREENSIAALETMSRFAIDPRWLIYLPPTMSPTETSKNPDLLEHPDEAITYYHKRSVTQLICQEKHMGSRAIVIVCKNNQTARKRFSITNDSIGICYTRTGRNFFQKIELEYDFLERMQQAIGKSGLWEELNTDWLCLDCEIMPWSAKAQALLEQQYAPVAAAAEVALPNINDLLSQAIKREIPGTDALLKKFNLRLDMIKAYRNAYRRYCWPVESLDDYKLAPFHILAFENGFNLNKDHLWHLKIIDQLYEADRNLFKKTDFRLIDTNDKTSWKQAVDWWMELVNSGGEGIVIKPLSFTVKTTDGLIQPGIKCRGREYLRIIYGPEYSASENIERLRMRDLRLKRSLALREYALGYEALNLFVNRAPLYKVHEAIFGVLALESEPVDPRF